MPSSFDLETVAGRLERADPHGLREDPEALLQGDVEHAKSDFHRW
jgi:hypothetical protein